MNDTRYHGLTLRRAAKRKKRYSFINLFAGCGGLSLGLMHAGWRGILAVEKDDLAFGTLSENLINGPFPRIRFDWPRWFPKAPCKINTFISKNRKEFSKLRGHVDLLAGGPPCQGFSFAGKRKISDPRNQLFKNYVTVVDLVRPKFLLLENVEGITIDFGREERELRNRNGVGRPPKPFSRRITESLEGLGYRVFGKLIKAVDFGVPQLRPRFIVLGIKKSLIKNNADMDPFGLLYMVRPGFLKQRGLPTKRPVGVREAISDLESRGKNLVDCVDSPDFKQIVYEGPRTYYQRLIHANMNGVAPNSLRLVNHRDKTVTRFRKILKTCRKGVQLSWQDRERLGISKLSTVPLDGDKPSHTVTTLPDDLLHYSEPRILTVRELARLQSFPDWFEFMGKYTTGDYKRVLECPRYTQVGNAVPPLLAEAIGEALILAMRRLVRM